MTTGQRRGRSIAMDAAGLDVFLAGQRTCRVATIGRDGAPHVSPVWFVWHDGALWIYSLTRSQRWTDLQRDPRVAVVADDGHHYGELHGAEFEGAAQPVGPVPRTGGEQAPAELAEPERQMAAKYFGLPEMLHDGRHAWLKVTPGKITSWDFRKLPGHLREPSSDA
jgi:PPOX class probable F420-dependent enzyme